MVLGASEEVATDEANEIVTFETELAKVTVAFRKRAISLNNFISYRLYHHQNCVVMYHKYTKKSVYKNYNYIHLK